MATDNYWRIKQAFEALLELSEEQRRAQIAEIAASEPEMAAVLARRLARIQANVLPESRTEDVEAITPKIAGYRVLAAAGAGGMGRVWKVQRTAQPEQMLALKQIHQDRLTPDLRRRFEQERSVLARLNHPNIVPLVDAGVDADNRPYLVTTWVEGLRIDQWCTEQQAPVAARVKLVRDLAQAIGHAHAQLIIHRDLKPANVLVDRDGHLRVLDFGIAKLLDQTDQQGHDTTAGFSLMTLRYAAPEQVQAGLIGPASDLYAIGVLLYELIAGHSPYLNADSPAALTQAITQQEPIAPSRRSANTLSMPHAGDLDAIVLKLLRKNADDRYGSTQELIADLNRWLQGEVVLARSDERGYLWRRWLWRWRWAAAALAVLPILVGWHVWRLDRELAETARQRDRARAVADYFVNLFRNADPGDARDGDISARALLEASASQLQDDQGLHADTKSLLELVTGRVYSDLGMITEAEPLLAQAITSMESESPLPIDELLDAYRTHAAVLYQLDRVNDSFARSQRAIQLLEAEQETQSERYAGMLQNAALALATMGRQSEADVLFAKALRVLEQNHPQSRAYVLLLLNLGGDRASLLDHRAALSYLDKAEAVGQTLQQEDPDLWLTIRRAALSSRLELAATLAERTKLGTDIDDGLKYAQDFYGQAHLETAFWSELKGMQAALTEQYAQAASYFGTASVIAEKLLPEANHPYRQRFDFNTLIAELVAHPKESDRRQRARDYLTALQRDMPDAAEHQLLEALLALLSCRPAESAKELEPQRSAAASIKTLPAWLQQILQAPQSWLPRQC